MSNNVRVSERAEDQDTSSEGPDGLVAAEPAQPASAEKKPEPTGASAGKGRSFLRELPILLVVAFVLALLIKTFVVQAFYIPSPSMEPTLQKGDRVLVNRNAYRFHPPRRGDIIVFSDPHPAAAGHQAWPSVLWHWITQGFGVSGGGDKDFIKRVIGLPGETVELHHGTVYINGRPLKPEPYLDPIRDLRDWGPHRIPPDHYFVLGDNRADSGDSRYGLGDIPAEKIIGRAFIIVWPPGRIRWLSGHPLPTP